MLQIHKASAGSGKTFTLTRQYITLLLGHRDKDGTPRLYTPRDYGFLKPKPHARILAITFTNKATQEMTTRVIKELSRLAHPEGAEPSAHLEYLCKYYRATPAQIAQGAATSLADLLFNYSYFNISTIDSFFQNVLHTFTRELDLPENFRLEIDEMYPVSLAVGQMISSINVPLRTTDKEERRRRGLLKGWLRSYMQQLIEGGKNANLLARSTKLNSELIKTIASLRGESYKKNAKAIDRYLSDPDRITRFAGGLRGSLQRLVRSLTDGANAIASLPQYDLIPKTLRTSYIEPWCRGDISYTPLGRVTVPNAIEDESKRHNKPKKNLPWTEDVDALLLSVLQMGMTVARTELFYTNLLNQIYLLGLFSEASIRIDEYCRDNESFLLGDTNQLLRKVIVESETPFIYERIGYQINHFLIDEFQDTSEMQWDNLRPLVNESLSRNNANLIIGDEKQCIYRFRNSTPELLGGRVEAAVKQRFGPTEVTVKGLSIDENTNWRSSADVVTFNNSLFTALSQPLTINTYRGLIQQVSEKHRSHPGYVKMLFGPQKAFTPAEDDLNDDGTPKEAYSTWTPDDQLRLLGQEISRQLSAGYRPGDIAVLVRSHENGEGVIDYLLDLMHSKEWPHGIIDIISADALAISTSPAVQLIIGMLRLSTTPQYVVDTDKPVGPDGVPSQKLNGTYLRNRLIHRYELCVYDTTEDTDGDGNVIREADGSPRMRPLTPGEALAKAIKACSVAPGENNPDPLQQHIDLTAAETVKMDCPSLFAITERIIRRHLPEQSCTREATFISAFQDLVLEYEEGGNSDVQGFLQWWDKRGRFTTLPAPDGMNAINVMTIHQSKGLEFECVHIPFCQKTVLEYKGCDWYALNPQGFPGISPEDVPPFIPLEHKKDYAEIPMLQKQAVAYADDQIVDALNVAYVAFTRAVSELNVYASLAKNGDTMARRLYDAAHAADASFIADLPLDPQEKQWLIPLAGNLTEGDRGMTVYRQGSPTIPHSDSSDSSGSSENQNNRLKSELAEISEMAEMAEMSGLYDANGFPLNTLYYMGNPKRPESFDVEIDYENILGEYRVERPADMELASDAEQQGTFDIRDERHLGNFLHDVLANVYTPADLPLAMERAAYRRNLHSSQWQPYLETLQKAIAAEDVKPWFEGYADAITERPLTGTPTGENRTRINIRRPDRVVWHPDGRIDVIDYKFGEPHPRYLRQVREYISLLRRCGFSNLHGYLYYPLTGKITPVS